MTAHGLIVDLFAGGGGASLGLEMALGRAVDVAINHNPEAVAIHAANHPTTRHFTQNIYDVLPRVATLGQPVDILWASPDCKHFSKAKGAAPKERNIRELGWAVVRWIQDTKPKIVFVENVEEFQTWGPLDAQGTPIKERAGETFKEWVKAIEAQGYRVERRLLKACDYGAPTIRRRLFIVARRDRKPIVWPEPTHGPGRPKPWRTAAECIDWSLPVPSIFDRKKPLAENTQRRIAEGMRRYVIKAREPFIVPASETSSWILQANTGVVGRPADWPLSTVCQTGSHQQLASASLVHYYGPRPGSRPRCGSVADPFRTVTADGNRFGLALASLVQVNHAGGFRGQSALMPLPTISQRHGFGVAAACLSHYNQTFQDGRLLWPHKTVTAGGLHAGLVMAFLTKYFGRSTANSIEAPVSTLCAGIKHYLTTAYLTKYFGTALAEPLSMPASTLCQTDKLALTCAFLTKYFGTAYGQSLQAPMATTTTRDRFGLVVVQTVPLIWIEGEAYVIVDIGLRMLTPRELARAQGFPDGYNISPIYKGKPLSHKAQVSSIGNSVPPPFAEALALANLDALDYQPPVRQRTAPLFEPSHISIQ